MDFAPSAANAAFRKSVCSFVDERVLSEASGIDRCDEFPHELIAEIGSRSRMEMPFSPAIGGAGVDVHADADGICKRSQGSGSLGTIREASSRRP